MPQTLELLTGQRDPQTCDIVQMHPEAVQAAEAALPDAETIREMGALFKALGDPTRLVLLAALGARELCVCDLAAVAGLSHSAVSHHLRTLRQLRLVRSRRAGKLVYYRLADAHVATLCAQTREHLTESDHRTA